MHCHDPECGEPDEMCDVCYGEGELCECGNPYDGRVGQSAELCADCVLEEQEEAKMNGNAYPTVT